MHHTRTTFCILYLLFQNPVDYEDWRHYNFPNLLEVLEEFPSVKPYAPVLIFHLTPLQPRFYSISSSPLVHLGQIHLTVAVVQYRTKSKPAQITNLKQNFTLLRKKSASWNQIGCKSFLIHF